MHMHFSISVEKRCIGFVHFSFFRSLIGLSKEKKTGFFYHYENIFRSSLFFFSYGIRLFARGHMTSTKTEKKKKEKTMACIQTPPGTKSKKKNKKKDKKNAERSSLPTSFNPKKKETR